MKPLTSLFKLSKWLLRIAIFFVVFTQYYDIFMQFNLSSIGFYVSAVFLIFGVLLLAGGFLDKDHLTVVSSLLILLASIYMSVVSFDGITSKFAINVLVGTVAFLFLTNGNK